VKISVLELRKNQKNDYFFHKKPPNYHAAFMRHFKCGLLLYEGKMFKDSYQALTLSVECLFKDIFCMVRNYVFQHQNTKDRLTSMLGDKKKELEDFEKLFSAEKFSHDIPRLIIVIKGLISEYNKGEQAFIFAEITNDTQNYDWVGNRYSSDEEDETDYQIKSVTLKSSILQLVESSLPHIYDLKGFK